jgi:hypothetical protein
MALLTTGGGADIRRHPAIDFAAAATPRLGISSHLWETCAAIVVVAESLQLSDSQAASANTGLG